MRYKIKSMPPMWVSAHRENRYKIRLPQTTISSGYNSGGFLKLNLAGAFPFPLNVGDRIYITDPSYKGFHTVKEIVSSVQIVLNTQFSSTMGGSIVVWQVYLPTISIYKGYRAGELTQTHDTGTLDYYYVLPFELVAQFKPEANSDGYLEFDICGYLKTVLDAPYKAAYNPDEESFLYRKTGIGNISYFAPKYSNKVEVFLDDTKIRTHYVCNSSITTEDLNRNFVDTERQLQPLLQPVKYFDSYKIADYINNNLLTAKLT